MQKKEPFDRTAANYDGEFTDTAVGRYQRKVVHRYLLRVVRPGMNILEINCGTGEDALFLAGIGCRVTATDSSGGMILEARKKGSQHPAGHLVVFRKLSFSELGQLAGQERFDLVLSNFSGLNCLDPDSFHDFSATLNALLNPGGSMIFILFGKRCVWEHLYLLMKGRYSDIHRRNRKQPVFTGLPGDEFRVWYYSKRELQKLLGNGFAVVSSRPVGLFLPPSYLGHFFRNKNWLLGILAVKERLLGRISFLSDFGDHYLVHLRKP